ncbi:dynamin family protein [Candidatus Bathyarchaeota archaeon]|nr:dynamin family protein [Candidatus Bathyarchaeota archaeon]
MPPPDITTALDGLCGKAQPLLDIIDSLHDLDVAKNIRLPQIIVVGDRSSGKSSVLKTISNVPFPVKSDTCTRFAIEIVFRN